MEAADGSSNKSRLLVKEPIARKGRNKSRAVLHRDSCYLLWHGVVSPVRGVMGDSDSSPPHIPPPHPPSPPWFLPSLVTHWTGAWWPRRIGHSPGIQFLPNLHRCAVWFGQTSPLLCASCPHALCCCKNVGSLCQDFTFACEGPRGSWNGLNTRSQGFSPTADSSPDSSVWKGEILGLPCQSSR